MTKTIRIEIKCKTAAHLIGVADLTKQARNYEFRIAAQGMHGMTAWLNVVGKEQLVRDAIGTIPALGGLPVAIAEAV